MIFSIGACGYGMIEVIWRGYTHWSMLCAGGFSFLGLSSISRQMKRCGRFLKAAAGSAFITGIEYVFGVVFNIILKKNVWDYSRMPFNVSGQICAVFVLLAAAELCRRSVRRNDFKKTGKGKIRR